MISYTLFLSLFSAGMLEIFVPVLLGFYLSSKLGARWGVFFVGSTMFLLSMIRIPINSLASTWVYSNTSGNLLLLLVIAFPSLTSGLFEEGARWIAFRFFVKDHKLTNGLMYGAGHGGIESILLVGVSVLGTAIYAYFYPQLLSEDQLYILSITPEWTAFAGLWERFAAISFHLGMSVLVLQSVRLKKPIYLLTAIIAHFLFNFTAVYISQYGLPAAEGVTTLWGLVALFYVWRMWRSERNMSFTDSVQKKKL